MKNNRNMNTIGVVSLRRINPRVCCTPTHRAPCLVQSENNIICFTAVSVKEFNIFFGRRGVLTELLQEVTGLISINISLGYSTASMTSLAESVQCGGLMRHNDCNQQSVH